MYFNNDYISEVNRMKNKEEYEKQIAEQQAIIDKQKKRIQRQNQRARDSWDLVSCRLPKGTTNRIKNHGETVNGFINRLVLDELERMDAANTSGSKANTDYSGVPF
jgi:phosphoketolase